MMNPYNYRGTPPVPGGTQPGWPSGSNTNVYPMPAQYGGNPSQYMRSQPPVNAGFYPQQATSMTQYQHQYQPQQQQQFQQQQPLQQANIHAMQQQQPIYQGQAYQQQPYQQSYQQGYRQQPLQQQQQQQHQQFNQSQMPPFQQKLAPPPPFQQQSAQLPPTVDPAVARRQQEKMMRDAQKKKEFEEQKLKFRSVVIGAPVVNPVDALFGKPSPPTVKKQPAKQVEELPKHDQKTEVLSPMTSTLQQEKEKIEESSIQQQQQQQQQQKQQQQQQEQQQQQQEKAVESPSVDLLLSESLKTLDLKKGSPKVKRFQQSSFQTHKPPGASQPTTFISSDKARNWSAASDELSGMFSEADEFTQFEAAPLQQSNQVTNQMISGQSQAYPQHQQYPTQSIQGAYNDDFGTFQSVTVQPVTGTAVASNQQTTYNVPQTHIQTFAAFPQPITTTSSSSQLPSVIGQQVIGPAPSDDFGMFQSTMTPSLQPASSSQQIPPTIGNQDGSNRDLFGDFQSGANNPTIAPVVETGQQAVYPSTYSIPMPSDLPYWERSIDQLPKLYQDVFNMCVMADQFLDTKYLFPILSSSGLQRSLLRDLWSTVNKVQPGRLTKEELCQILGLIALAQSGMSNPSLLELSKQSHPPVPQLVLKQTNTKETGAASLTTVNNEADPNSKYGVFKAISEPSSSSTLASTEAATSLVVTSTATAPSVIPVASQVVGDSDNKYDVFKIMSETSNPPSNPPLVPTDSNSKFDVFKSESETSVSSSAFSESNANQLLTQPLTSTSELFTSANRPLFTTSQPSLSTTQALASTSQSLTLTSQPLASTIQPLTSTSQPLISAGQPLISTNQPLALTNQPVKDAAFEFGEFQGSSNEQPVISSTNEDNWACFESAFSSNEDGLLPASLSSSQNTTQQSYPTTTTTTTTTTTIASSSTSGPSQFAVFDEVNFPPTTSSTDPPVSISSSTNVVSKHAEDKYSVFNAVRLDNASASTASNEDSSEFGQFEMSQPPTNNQDIRTEQYSTQMEIFEKCLQACDNTLSTTADLLSQVKERKVLNELFNSTPGMNKAQSYFEMFKLAKRVASTAVQLDGEAFTNVKKHWKKIVQAFPPGLLTKLSNSGNSPSVTPRSVSQDQKCSICGFGSKVLIPGDASYHRDLFVQGATTYHVVCANTWTHLISKELPVCSEN